MAVEVLGPQNDTTGHFKIVHTSHIIRFSPEHRKKNKLYPKEMQTATVIPVNTNSGR